MVSESLWTSLTILTHFLLFRPIENFCLRKVLNRKPFEIVAHWTACLQRRTTSYRFLSNRISLQRNCLGLNSIFFIVLCSYLPPSLRPGVSLTSSPFCPFSGDGKLPPLRRTKRYWCCLGVLPSMRLAKPVSDIKQISFIVDYELRLSWSFFSLKRRKKFD